MQTPNPNEFVDSYGVRWIWDASTRSYQPAAHGYWQNTLDTATGGDTDAGFSKDQNPLGNWEKTKNPLDEGIMAKTADYNGWDYLEPGTPYNGIWSNTIHTTESQTPLVDGPKEQTSDIQHYAQESDLGGTSSECLQHHSEPLIGSQIGKQKFVPDVEKKNPSPNIIASSGATEKKSCLNVNPVTGREVKSAEKTGDINLLNTIPTEHSDAPSVEKVDTKSLIWITSMVADTNTDCPQEEILNQFTPISSKMDSPNNIESCAGTVIGLNGSTVKTSEYAGWRNWETWHVALMIDNDEWSYNESRKIVRSSPNSSRLEQWAIENIIGPYNNERIKDAKEWNTIPEPERIDYGYEDFRNKSPQAADIYDNIMGIFGGGGPDVSDVDPELIDPNLVDWDEIYTNFESELEEEERYSKTSETIEAPGVGTIQNFDFEYWTTTQEDKGWQGYVYATGTGAAKFMQQFAESKGDPFYFDSGIGVTWEGARDFLLNFVQHGSKNEKEIQSATPNEPFHTTSGLVSTYDDWVLHWVIQKVGDDYRNSKVAEYTNTIQTPEPLDRTEEPMHDMVETHPPDCPCEECEFAREMTREPRLNTSWGPFNEREPKRNRMKYDDSFPSMISHISAYPEQKTDVDNSLFADDIGPYSRTGWFVHPDTGRVHIGDPGTGHAGIPEYNQLALNPRENIPRIPAMGEILNGEVKPSIYSGQPTPQQLNELYRLYREKRRMFNQMPPLTNDVTQPDPNPFPEMGFRQIVKGTNVNPKNPHEWNHVFDKYAWEDSQPDLDSCPTCESPMTNKADESVCHTCGHRQPVIYAKKAGLAGLGEGAALALPWLLGPEAGAPADAALMGGAGLSGAAGAAAPRLLGGLMNTVMGGGGSQQPQQQQQGIPEDQIGTVAKTSGEEIGEATKIDGQDVNPNIHGTDGNTNRDGEGPENTKNHELGSSSEGLHALQQTFKEIMDHITNFLDPSVDGSSDPIMKALDQLLEAKHPGYRGQENPGEASIIIEAEPETEDLSDETKTSAMDPRAQLTQAIDSWMANELDDGTFQSILHNLKMNSQGNMGSGSTPGLMAPTDDQSFMNADTGRLANLPMTPQQPAGSVPVSQVPSTANDAGPCEVCGRQDHPTAMHDVVRHGAMNYQPMNPNDMIDPANNTPGNATNMNGPCPYCGGAHAGEMHGTITPGQTGMHAVANMYDWEAQNDFAGRKCPHCSSRNIEEIGGGWAPESGWANLSRCNDCNGKWQSGTEDLPAHGITDHDVYQGLNLPTAKVKESRRPKMCPYHTDIVDYSLTLGDPTVALQTLTPASYGTRWCKSPEWRGGTCNFAPAMVKQEYWDKRQQELENKKLERQQADVFQQQEEEIQSLEETPDAGMDSLEGYSPSEVTDISDVGAPMEMAASTRLSWTDAQGNPLIEGQTYKMKAPNYSIPDDVTINRIGPNKIDVTVHGDMGINYSDSYTPEQIQQNEYSFMPQERPQHEHSEFTPEENDEYKKWDPTGGQNDLSDLPTPVSHTEEAAPVEDMTMVQSHLDPHLAGRNYTMHEQQQFVNEAGMARNIDNLDLTGSHYGPLEDYMHNIDDEWLW